MLTVLGLQNSGASLDFKPHPCMSPLITQKHDTSIYTAWAKMQLGCEAFHRAIAEHLVDGVLALDKAVDAILHFVQEPSEFQVRVGRQSG